jgi:transposase
LYSTTGRPSVPPEKLLRALLLQMLYSIRSERLLMEELDYNILYRWFVGLSLDDAVWDATTFTKNRDRLLDGDIADAFFAEVLAAIKADGLLSDEHFTVDGTLLEAWASHKSFKPKDTVDRPPDDPKNPTVNFHGQTRRNDTHQSTTDPDARLYKKAVGREAKLGYLAHLLTENRHGLIIDTAVTAASGTAERDAAIAMLGELPLTTRRLTVAGDKAYDTRAWVAAASDGDHPHVAQNDFGWRQRDRRTTSRHDGYRLSHRKRKLIEQAFGWLKTVALFRKLRHRGGRLVDWLFSFGAAAYNLVRWRNLVAQRA